MEEMKEEVKEKSLLPLSHVTLRTPIQTLLELLGLSEVGATFEMSNKLRNDPELLRLLVSNYSFVLGATWKQRARLVKIKFCARLVMFNNIKLCNVQ